MNIPKLPVEFKGRIRKRTHYTLSDSRSWSEYEEEFVFSLYKSGHSVKEISNATDRTEASITNKLRRLKKKNGQYNDSHREQKYEANEKFVGVISPDTVLDLYCGTNSWYKTNLPNCCVVTNDKNKDINANYHDSADRILALMYSEHKSFDIIDIDPFGSGYMCFHHAIDMAKKGIIITFGELGHKRQARFDYVGRMYGITKMSQFTTKRLISEVNKLAIMHKKKLVPVIVCDWGNISRVYFKVEKVKVKKPLW